MLKSNPSLPEGTKNNSGVGMKEKIVFSEKVSCALNLVHILHGKLHRRKELIPR
jgi:hypothetical protein